MRTGRKFPGLPEAIRNIYGGVWLDLDVVLFSQYYSNRERERETLARRPGPTLAKGHRQATSGTRYECVEKLVESLCPAKVSEAT